VPYGPAATAALSEAIAAAQANDILAPVTVIVPSNIAGLSLRRTMGRREGLLNVRFMVLARLAELLGAGALAAEGRGPLTRWRRYEAVRNVLRSDAGVFAPVASHPSTLTALDSAFRELRDITHTKLEETAVLPGRQGDVARLYLRFRAATTDSYDASDLAVAATAAVRSGQAPGLDDIGTVIVYLPGPLTPASSGLVEALLDGGHGMLIGGLTGEAGPDARVWGTGGTQADVNGHAAPIVASQIVLAADAEEEARNAIRCVMAAAADGAPLARMAILYPGAGDYGALLHEQLESAGIPHNGPATGSLADSVPARALTMLLALRDDDLTRVGVFEWMAAAPIIEATEGEYAGRLAPSRRWEKIAREAGIVGGIEQWRSRLGVQRQLREASMGEAIADGDEVRAAGYERDIETIGRLLSFIEELHGRLAHQEEPPQEHIERIRRVLERYLGSDARHDSWPAAEAAAYQRVDEILREAASSAAGGGAFGPGEIRNALEWLLAEPGERIGPFGQGVFVGPVSQAAGMHFERVYVVGMAEGLLPAPVRIDALLPDDEREQVGLAPVAEMAAEDRRRYLAALATAPERTLIYGKADLRGGRVRQPSRWLLESASRHAGTRLTASAFEEHAPAAWLTRVPSFAAGVRSAVASASPAEFDVGMLAAAPRALEANELFLLPEFGGVRLGIEAAKARMVRTRGVRPALSRWEAAVGAAIRGPSSAGAPPVSPTALEVMATCPFRYFLKHQLGVRELEEPPDELRISPLVKGSLVHRILERFFVEAAGEGLAPDAGEPWPASAHDRMRELAEEECAIDEAHGLTGAPLLWQLDRQRIFESLRRVLLEDDEHRARGDRFSHAEMAFGDGEATASLALPSGGTIRFRGRIDRVDRHANGNVVVYDYKTGRSKPYDGIERGELFDNGRHLQLPVYALALGAGTGAGVEAYYWFVEDAQPLKGYAVDHQRLDGFGQVVGALDATIGAGLFPANPGGTRSDQDNCRNCAFERVCPPRGTRLPRLVQRAAATPGLSQYAALAGLAALTEEDVQDDDDAWYD
jgi:RecB family exonuclease